MLVLTVDTSTSYVVAGVVEIEQPSCHIRTRAQRVVDNPRGHMELLTPNIVECLAEASLEPEDLDAVVVGVGPGPFTGLRVGMATGQAFADALSIPLHGVTSLAGIAVNAFQSGQAVDSTGGPIDRTLVVTDARRREWYWAAYELDGQWGEADTTLRTLVEPAVDKPAQVQEAGDSSLPVLAAQALSESVSEVLTDWTVADSDAQPTPESLVLTLLLQRGGVNAVAVRSLLTPGAPLRALYLRRPDAIEPKRKPVSTALDFGENASQEVAVDAGEDSYPRLVQLDQQAAPAMARMEQELFAGDSPWPLSGIQQELAAMNTTYFGLLGDEDKLIGYLGLAKNGPSDDPEWEIHTVAVDPAYQGQGLSHVLMTEALKKVDRFGGHVFLEVRTDNASAVGLYQRYGFQITGTRKNYYQPSGADAYTMMRPSFGSTDDVCSVGATGGNTAGGNSAGHDSAGTGTGVAVGEEPGMVILGVESSCDETGVGIVELRRGAQETEPGRAGERETPSVRMISNRVASSMEQHARFGGVVPEIASRAHLESMGPTMRQALRDLRADRARRGQATSAFEKPDAVAATIGPGLAGALLVGAAAAKAYAAAWKVPFYGVNHLGGHVAVDLLDQDTPSAMDNAIALLVSGGHTQILHVTGVGKPMEEMGSTLDDAAGEAYDKVARLLGLGYPGGPIIDKLAARGNPKAIAFPRGMMRPQDARYDFSFSGLKTAVARFVEKAERDGETVPIEDVCASFQEAVCDVLTRKAVRAAEDVGATTMLLGGGVSANSRLRELLEQRCRSAGIELHIPRFNLCTDNGVMIAALAAQLIAAGGQASELTVGTDPGLDVEVPLV